MRGPSPSSPSHLCFQFFQLVSQFEQLERRQKNHIQIANHIRRKFQIFLLQQNLGESRINIARIEKSAKIP